MLKGDLPEAVILHLEPGQSPEDADLRLAMAAALFKARTLSIGRAARVAGVGLAALVTHLSRLGIPVVEGDAAEVESDLDSGSVARLVLTDASPLIGLDRVEGLGWLRTLFGTVEMTRSVYRELADDRGLEAGIAAAIDAGWLVAGEHDPEGPARPGPSRPFATVMAEVKQLDRPPHFTHTVLTFTNSSIPNRPSSRP